MRWIQQVNLLLGQWTLGQKFHEVSRADCICRQEGGQLSHDVSSQSTAAQMCIVVRGEDTARFNGVSPN